MYFNIEDLAKAWDKKLKGKKIEKKLGSAMKSQSFFALTQELVEIIKLKRGWVRNEPGKKKEKSGCCLN